MRCWWGCAKDGVGVKIENDLDDLLDRELMFAGSKFKTSFVSVTKFCEKDAEVCHGKNSCNKVNGL